MLKAAVPADQSVPELPAAAATTLGAGHATTENSLCSETRTALYQSLLERLKHGRNVFDLLVGGDVVDEALGVPQLLVVASNLGQGIAARLEKAAAAILEADPGCIVEDLWTCATTAEASPLHKPRGS